eukprot:TRINITY_DN585_c0_g1_i1.p1 TRINITY_DN585_c0_g1~~TRINITY_DN585_c0_g1_i1.p1  ORF type:complete len:116 (+),score=0.20 TRINITY_DN585_c0_g1_i1:267-614(+)
MVALFSSDITCINLALGASFSISNNCASKINRNVVFGIYVDIDCLSKNFGNVTTSETCVKEGGSSDVVTCASSSHINIPVNLDAGQAKENSATAARVVQTSQILTFVALCIILLL